MAALDKELDPRFAKAFGVFAGIIAFLVLYFYFASLGKLVPPHADSAYLVSYANAILRGNYLLRDWNLSTVGFYSELPIYVVAVRVMGMSLDVMRLVPAFIYTCNTFLIIALIHKLRITKGRWIFAVVLPFIILPANGVWPLGLTGAIHMVTAMSGLIVVFLLGDRLIAESVWRSVVIALLCFIAVWSDLAFVFFFAIPILLAVYLLHRNDHELLRKSFLSAFLPVGIGSLLGHLFLLQWQRLGFGSPVGTGEPHFDSPAGALAKLDSVAYGWNSMFGFDFWEQPLNVQTLCALVMGIGWAIWLAAAFRAIRSRDSAFDLIATLSILVSVAAVALSRRLGDGDEIRFLVPAYFLGVVLISRQLQRFEVRTEAMACVGLTTLAAAVVSAPIIRSNKLLLAGDAYGNQFKRVSELLLSRGLTDGFGDYWAAQPLAVASNGRLSITQLAFGPERDLRIQQFAFNRKRFRSNPKGSFAVFHGLLAPTLHAHYYLRMTAKDIVRGSANADFTEREQFFAGATAYWGVPSERHDIGDMVILIWDSPKHIESKDLAPAFR